MAYERQYTQGVGWQNEPSINTPISAENLNQMDVAIQDVDEAVYNAFNNIESKQRNRFRHAVMTNSGAVISLQCGTIVDAYSSVDDLHDGDILVLYVSNAISLSSGSTWKVQAYKKVDASSTVSILKELRDANGANITSNFSAGSLLFMLYDATNNYWKLQETITSNGGGGGGGISIYAEHVVGQNKVMHNPNMEMASMPFSVNNLAIGDLLFLYIDTQADLVYDGDTQYSTWWLAVNNGQSSILPVVDSRQESNIYAYFREDLEAGSALILSAVGDSATVEYFGVRAVIPAAGGGGGTTVIANPSGAAAYDLEKLQVGSTIYAINAGNSAEGFKITAKSSTSTEQDELVTNIQLDSGIAEHEGDVFYLTSEINTGTSSTGWNVRLEYAVGSGYVDTDVPLFGMNPTTVMDMFSGSIATGDIIVVKLTHSGIVSGYAMYILAYISASGGGSSTLAGLTDTNISSPTDKQPLTYDNATSKWINGGVIPKANGGTGNTAGYVRAGQKANTSIGGDATAEGIRNTASGNQSHAEGADTVASNTAAHAEGSATQATGVASHAEGGGGVVASGQSSHAEGSSTQASGNYSHAEGQGAKAQANATHAQNFYTTASANYSSAAGYYTTAGYQNQFVVGKYNNNKSTSIFEVGIGTASNAKANGLELDTSGNLKTAGTITDGQGHVLGQAVVADGVWVISGETATLTVTTP